ncbi:MAG: hypothetical protein HY593_06530 [Candidatus Omnitrophica bacterium]|nr:hypothetical protein [Candidatus Omnitrophota bacterium]
MSVQEGWEKALKHTEIVRPRVQPLHSFEATRMPYMFLAESSVNSGDTVVRKGEVVVERPAIFLPFPAPHFEGFHFQEEMKFNEDFLINFLLVRGITFPSLKYDNQTDSIDVFEGRLSQAIQHCLNRLQREEDIRTGLIMGTEDTWQFSVLIFICSQVARNADQDVKSFLEELRKRGGWLS